MTHGRFRKIRGRIKAAWGKLTGNDALQLEGDTDVALGSVEERVGDARNRAVRAIDRGADAIAKRLRTVR